MSKVMEYVDTFTQNKDTKKIERVACYIRVSTQEQKLHGISLDAQRDKLTEYAKKHNLKIVEWYEDEGVSGRKLIKNRPELQRMIKDAQAGKFDRIIFIKLDRFFRSIAEYHECMKLIDPVLWTATEEKYDLTTANGRAFVNMKITIAELEADQTGERIDIVNDYKIKTGQAISGAQSQGIAFTVQKIDNIKRVVPDPATKDICIDFINHFLIHHNKRQSVLYVNEKYHTNIHYNSLTKMLKDTKLYGYYKGNPNYCEPYIDKKTFDKIQLLQKSNIKQTPSKKTYLFTGLMYCPKCGTKLIGSCSTKRTCKRPNGKTYVYDNPIFQYRCSKHTTSKLCDNNKYVSEKKLEEALLDKLDHHIKEYITTSSVLDDRADSDNEAVNIRIKEIKSEMKNTTTAFRKNRMTEKEYDKEYDELERQLHELEAKLLPHEERDVTIYEEVLNSEWRILYNDLTRENKRAFWRKYIKEIIVDEKGAMTRPVFF